MKTDTNADRAANAATRAKRPVFQIDFATWYSRLAGFSTPPVTPIALDLAIRGRRRDPLALTDATRAA